ncbi:MAG: sensor histidine kinase [Candidatus Fimenecus sp.]
MIKTLQKKFVITAMAAVSVLLVFFIAAINILNCVTTVREIDRTLDFLISSGKQKAPAQKLDKGGIRDFISPLPDEDSVREWGYFTVKYNTDGDVIMTDVSRISLTQEEAQQTAEELLGKGGEGYVGRYKYKISVSPDGEETTVVCIDTAMKIRTVATTALISVFVGIVCWAVMLLLVIFLSKRAIKPIAENIERQKQFVTNAGHEIKTPLAIILANTDALELHNGENKWSKNIRAQTVRLNGLMQNLLTLAKNDESQQRLTCEMFNASELLNETAETFFESAVAQGVTVSCDIEPDVQITANRESIRQLYSVLIDNAVKYGKCGSEIFISLKAENERSVFTVQNTCDNLPDCEPEKLFDRFYRGDSARTQKSGGYGIGLSVARAVAEGAGGEIKAEYKNGNTVVFTVKI